MADATVSPAGEKREFYVYIWYRAGGVPCYVGKGKGARWKEHVKKTHNVWLKRIFAKEGDVMYSERITGLAESEAFELERFLIAEIGRKKQGGPLVNLTDGGEGISGFTHSQETIERLAAASKGQPAWNAGMKGCFSAETIEKMRFAKQGLPQTAEHRAKIGAAHLGRKWDPEFGKKVSAGRKGIKVSAEGCARIKKGNRSGDPKVRAKIRASVNAAYAADPTLRTRCVSNKLNLTDEERVARRRKQSRENARRYRKIKRSDKLSLAPIQGFLDL